MHGRCLIIVNSLLARPFQAMDITLTPDALDAARRDLSGGERLRIAVAGGCGAMGFRLAASRRRAEGDLDLDIEGVPLTLDRQAVSELDGATLDYDEDEGFLIDHPAWGRSC
jgi:Fe-S cluster assembly iron-binding protein IscA